MPEAAEYSPEEANQALDAIDKLLFQVLAETSPDSDIDVQQNQSVSMSHVASVRNRGHGIVVGGPEVSVDTSNGGYEAIEQLSQLAQLINEGPENDNGEIMEKIRDLETVLGSTAKLTKIAGFLGLAL